MGEALRLGVVDPNIANDLVIIAALWINPSANDEEEVFANQRQAMLTALTNGKNGTPTVETFMEASLNVSNPFFRIGK